MSTALQTAQKPKGLKGWVQSEEAKEEIAAAIGDIMPADQFTAHMLVAFRDEKIRHCSDQSKYRALMTCAALGMVPTLDQVKLIPYGDELKAMPQWQGYKAAMERHPDILEVVGQLVHVADKCSIEQGEPRHSYDPFSIHRNFKDAEDVRGGYLKIIYRDGRPPKYHFVPRKTIKQAQECAQTQKVWKAWYYEMALKTVYRNAYARRAVPMDPMVNSRLQQAVNADDLNLGNDPARITTEATTDHIEQARQQYVEEQEPPYDPPTSEEQSQVEAAVDAAEGVDEPPEGDPKEESDTQEAFLLKKINACRTRNGLTASAELVGEGDLFLTGDAVLRLRERITEREAELPE